MKTYTDLEDSIKMLQHADLPSHSKATMIQNVTVNTGGFDSVVSMIRQYGGVQPFIKALYAWVIQQHHGHISRAADTLMIPRQTLSEYRKKYLLSDDR